jgi:hypothetical protein
MSILHVETAFGVIAPPVPSPPIERPPILAGIVRLPLTRIRGRVFARLYVECPYCHEQHVHTWRLGDIATETRRSHCGQGEYRIRLASHGECFHEHAVNPWASCWRAAK